MNLKNKIEFSDGLEVLLAGSNIIKITNDKTGNEFAFSIIQSDVNKDLFTVKSIPIKEGEVYTVGEIRKVFNYFAEGYQVPEFRVHNWGKPTDVWNAVFNRLKKREAEAWINIEKIIEL